MRKLIVSLVVPLVLLAACAPQATPTLEPTAIATTPPTVAPTAEPTSAPTEALDPEVLAQLDELREATEKYQDVEVALADGFVQTPDCVASPDGGMGIHFVHPPRLMDPAENILEPEILLYVETPDGMKLLGVEYFYGIAPPDTALAAVPTPLAPAPVLFGIPFDGPMELHEPGQPPHYDLHVWIWEDNPSGMFAPFNPNVSCGN